MKNSFLTTLAAVTFLAALTTLAVITITFALVHLAPGEPFIGDAERLRADPATIARQRAASRCIAACYRTRTSSLPSTSSCSSTCWSAAA